MMRLAALGLLGVLVAFSLAVLPAAPVTWLVAASLVVGGAGVAALSVPVVTAAGALALVAYAIALAMAAAPADPLAAIAVGGLLLLLLALVHLAARLDGAAIGRRVIAVEIRGWLSAVAVGVAAAAALALGGGALGGTFQRMALPTVIVAAALGAVTTVAGLIALLTSPRR